MRTAYWADVYEADRVTLVKQGIPCHLATTTPPSDLARPLMDINTVGTHIIGVPGGEKDSIEPERFLKIDDNYYRVLKTQVMVTTFSPKQIRCLCRMSVDA